MRVITLGVVPADSHAECAVVCSGLSRGELIFDEIHQSPCIFTLFDLLLKKNQVLELSLVTVIVTCQCQCHELTINAINHAVVKS